ncbi:MAG: DUF1772 domain-containing protein [Syntrophobacteraceae bacterium]
MVILDIVKFIAALSCTLFTGAAIHVNLVGHPSRLGCYRQADAAEWEPSFKRATMMQALLAILSCLAGVGAWRLSGDIIWLIGAIMIGLVVPFTLIAIMPANHKLLKRNRNLASDETRELLDKWEKLHSVRSVLSLIASLIYLVLLVRG